VNEWKHIADPSRLMEKLGELIARGQYRKALDLLDNKAEGDLPLFEDQVWAMRERRMSWLYKIDLLMEMGRVTEALAWACLEVELNPKNITAKAQVERLKRLAGFTKAQSTPGSSKPGRGGQTFWDGVAGMRELKAVLERDVILPLLEPELYRQYRLTLPNGILLYGPPGCGKTFIARKLAAILGFTFEEIKPGDLASIYVHGTQGKISQLFAQARQKAPCMLFFDEIEAMVPKRSGSSVGHHYAAEVNEFLVQLNECSKDRVLVVAATNLPELIDPAILRPGRLDKKIRVGVPDFEARVELLRINLRGRPIGDIDWLECADQLEGYSSAEIEFLVNESARHALSQKRNIHTNDILHAAGQHPSSIPASER